MTQDPKELIRKQCEKYNIEFDDSVIPDLSTNLEKNKESSESPGFLHAQGWENKESLNLDIYHITRDQDVLDTWFSSALWPFSVLDWDFENPGELFEKYYPANVLETGHDILFFWVIRMLLMGYEYTWQSPFKKVYLHGLVLNEDGKKMSKSAGTVIDPLSIIDEYSTDALRLALTLGNTPGNNLNFSRRDVEEYGLFLNKLWNIVRFSWMNVGDITETRDMLESRIQNGSKDLFPYERWILSRLASTIEKMTTGMNEYTFSSSGTELLSFIRDEFADFAIEAYKIEKEVSVLGKDVMKLCILDILALLHPYAPHITEMLYGQVTGGKILMISAWPKTELAIERESEYLMTIVFDIVRMIRNIRAESKIPPSEQRAIVIVTPEDYREGLEANARIIAGLGRGSTVDIGKKPIRWSGYAYGVVHGIDIYVDAHIDKSKVEEEKTRLLEQIEEKKWYLRILMTKLENNSFVANAPEKIVRIEMEKKHQAETDITKLEEKYKAFGGE